MNETRKRSSPPPFASHESTRISALSEEYDYPNFKGNISGVYGEEAESPTSPAIPFGTPEDGERDSHGNLNLESLDTEAPVAAEDSDFAFPPSLELEDVSHHRRREPRDENTGKLPPLPPLPPLPALSLGDDFVHIPMDNTLETPALPLEEPPEILMSVPSTEASQFQEEVTHFATLKSERTAIRPPEDHAPASHVPHLPHIPVLPQDPDEIHVVTIESRNTSSRELALSTREFALAEQQILEHRRVHIPGKVLILDAVAIFRSDELNAVHRRRRPQKIA